MTLRCLRMWTFRRRYMIRTTICRHQFLEEQARSLKALRKLPIKIRTIYDSRVASHYRRSHDDVLATIQPSYLRRLFTRPNEGFKSECSKPTRFTAQFALIHFKTRKMFNLDPNDVSTIFSKLFSAEDRQQAALNSAISDLFLMIFAPGIYFYPIKIQAFLPNILPSKRVRLSPFLTWSDVNLLCLTKSNVVQIFISDTRTHPHVIAALTHLATSKVEEDIATGPSRLVCPQL
ncbi:hypothetical protein PsorP6_012967 [Peronosclerospora sorghi]|uniref:Uncharacterized protein n=1 Tax=Peronosclerospora sorghi TaxID=230839 RepID=A0ACC0WGR1_9STRA|nr:hypothetical protein PsorP6_012967 [Peronosclerospora sorghi]